MSGFSMSKGRYLVTGGAGFVGSHLVDALLEFGCEVVCIDNFITGRPENIREQLKNKAFTFMEQDVVKPVQVDGALAGIFHLASPASPIDYATYPIETLRVGAIGSENILQVALEKKCPVLVTSTSEVYGDPLQHPQTESYWGNVNPVGPRGCYDESKRYLEALTMAYHRVHRLDTKIVRIFNTYGPRMRVDDGRVVPNFCMQALKHKDVTIYGNGNQTRSFCYVSDLVEGLMRMLLSTSHGPVNLGNPNELTVKKFADEIIRLTHSRSKCVFRELPTDDPKTRCPDIRLANEVLHWQPKVNLETGLAKTIEYFRGQA